jgi:hypothetical protein
MNALDRIFVNAGKGLAAARILGVAGGAALLSGCVNYPIASTKVDPGSPVAPEVARMARANTTYPSFNDIPPIPTDIRAPRVYGERAQQLVSARNQLDQVTAPNTWTLSNTPGFQAKARNDAGANINPPTASDTEAFANAIRKRATPPPPTNP